MYANNLNIWLSRAPFSMYLLNELLNNIYEKIINFYFKQAFYHARKLLAASKCEET